MTDARQAMDSIYRVQRHIYDVTRKPYLLGRDAMIDMLDAPPGATILEIGCGTGRNLILAARKYPQTLCFGIDVSGVMLETAERSINRAGLSHRIHVGQADATSFDPRELFGLDAFDRVFISYALSMMRDWGRALDNAASLSGPAGSLHVADFGDQRRLPALFRAPLNAWLQKFSVVAGFFLQ